MEVATIGAEVLLRCPKCEMKFANDTMLQRHTAEQMHKKKKEKLKKKKKEKKKQAQSIRLMEVDPSRGRVSCFCGRIFDSLEALGNHLSTHEEQDLATTTYIRGAHLQVVKNKPFACDLCSKHFKTQEGVQAHKAAKGNHSRRSKQQAVFKINKDMYSSRKKTLTRAGCIDEKAKDANRDSHENMTQVLMPSNSKGLPFMITNDHPRNFQYPDFPAIYPSSEDNSEETENLKSSSKGMEPEDEKEDEKTEFDPSDTRSFTSINLSEEYFVHVEDAEEEEERLDAASAGIRPTTLFCAICSKMDHIMTRCPWRLKIPDGERLTSSKYDVCCIGCGMLGKECCKKGLCAVVKTCGRCWLTGHWPEACPFYKPKAKNP